jgi:Putative peptidoglycan binding domain
MKRIWIFVIVVVATVTLMTQSAEASRGSGRSFSAAPHFSAPSRSFSGGGPRFYSGPRFQNRSYVNTMPRVSSTARFRNPAFMPTARRFAADRTTAFNSRRFTPGTARLTAANRTVASRQSLDRGRILARHNANWQPNWNRNRDHFWRGHRCHFRNGFWFIYDPFPWDIYPYGYGFDYYPYGAYYDSGYDNGAYTDNAYSDDGQYSRDPNADRSQPDSGSQVTQVQRALARAGYYDGAIDGTLGAGTRKALRNYQRDRGLDITGGINQAVIESLRLR